MDSVLHRIKFNETKTVVGPEFCCTSALHVRTLCVRQFLKSLICGFREQHKPYTQSSEVNIYGFNEYLLLE